MNKSKYIATQCDGKEILRILESSAAKGSIELLYTRRPDAYDSYMKEYGESRVFVSKKDGCLIGTCAELIRDVYIGSAPAKAAYLCGLKKDADYDGAVGFGVNFIRSLQRDEIDFYYCSVIADNKKALNIFGKSKRAITMKPIGDYTTYILNPKVRFSVKKHGLLFRRATESDKTALLEFLNSEGRKKDLFPVINSFEQFHNITYKNFYLLLKDNRIVAAAALWEQQEYKQYIVKKYRGIMKYAHIFNPVLSLLGYIKLPQENSALDFPMLSFFLSLDDNEEYYKIFLNEIKQEIGKKYEIFVIGLPKSHFATPIFKKLPSIRFDTRLYAIHFPWSDQSYKEVCAQYLYPECGLL